MHVAILEGSLHDGAVHRDLDGQEVSQDEGLDLVGIHLAETANRGRVGER
jgi:hypothetical protein